MTNGDSTGNGGSDPLVSVIVPVYNGEDYLAEALDSILAQTCQDLEIILVNDGSTDSSPALAQHYATAHTNIHCLHKSNGGVTVARNDGIRRSRGRYIGFLDQDDRWARNALEIHLQRLQANPALGYSVARQRCYLQPGAPRPEWFGLQELDTPVAGYLPGALLVRRELFEQIGYFDLRYPISADADWFARARDAGIPMAEIDAVVLERRIHRHNQSAQAERIHDELFNLLHASLRRKRTQA